MLGISTFATLSTYNQLNKNMKAHKDSFEKLSSGSRLNSADDDAAGMAISQKMESQTRALEQNARNIQDGVSLLDTADDAVDSLQGNTQRMRELFLQAANDTQADEDREAIRNELKELETQMSEVVRETEFNKMPLIDGTFSKKTEDASNELEPGLGVPEDGTATSQKMELRDFEVDFKFRDISDTESNKLKIEIWHKDQLLGESILEDDPLKWEESAGGSEIDIGSDIIATEDGFIAVGTTSSQDGDAQGSDAEDSIFAVKFNDNTDETAQERIEWAKTFQDSGVKAEGLSISDLPDEKGYLISGTTATAKGDSDMLLMKIDDSGDVSFKETYGGQDDFAKSIDNIEDGGKIVAGEVEGLHGQKDIFMLKIDSEGNHVWEKQIKNADNNDYAYDVKAVDDGYLVAGKSGEDSILHKLDTQGNLVNSTTNNYKGTIRDIEVLDDKSIVTVGDKDGAIEFRMYDENLGFKQNKIIANDINAQSDRKLGIEVINTSDPSEFIITDTFEADDGSLETNAFKLNSSIDVEWESYDNDAGSHGNKGEQIYASTGGGYLSTAGGLDNRMVQFDKHGIYQGEIDLSEYEDGSYADYEISQLISGSDSYHAVLENSTGEIQLAEINYSGGEFDESNLSITNIGTVINGQTGVDLASQNFEDLHLLDQGDSGYVIETSEGDNTLLHHFNADNTLKTSFEAADEFEIINNLTLNSNGNLSLVGSTERGDVEVGFSGVLDTAEIYQDLKLNFVTGIEGVSFDHQTKELEISLAESKDYDIAAIKNLIADNTRDEEVVSYYNAADFNDLITGIDDYTTDPTFNDPVKEYLNFEIDGAGKLNTFDLSDEVLTLTSNSGETASTELEVDGTTLRVTANTAFRAGEKISLTDDSNGTDETISFADDKADWSVDPAAADDVFSQAIAVKDIVNNELGGHSAAVSGNEITITENAGAATGSDLEITTADSPYLDFTVAQESVKEELGQYTFTVNNNFEDEDTLNISGEEFSFSTSPTAGEIEIVEADEADTENGISESEAVEETLKNLKAELELIEHWETAEVAGNQIKFTEAAGQASGSAPTLGLSTSTDSNADISNLTEENESVAEVQGEYTLTIGNNQAFDGKEIEFNSEPGFQPGDESAEIDADDKLTFDLAEDPDLENFDLSSEVAYETTGAKWEAGSELTVNEANNYSDSDFYRNSLENLFLKEFDNTGASITERTYGGSGVDTGLAIEELDGGGYIITGTSSSQDGQLSAIAGLDGSSKNWVTVLDQDLNIVDQEVETAEDPAQLTEIRKDGEAYSLFGKEEDDKPVIYKLSESSGSWELTLENRFETLNLENELSIAENNGEFLLTGNDSAGNLHNIFSSGQTTALSTKGSSAAAITTLADGSTVMAANKDVLTGSGGSEKNATVKKIDADGEPVWETQLDALAGIDGMSVQDIQHTEDGNFILTGMRNGEMAVYELDQNGETNWSETYEGLSSLSIDQADDGNYVITGHRDLENTEELYQSNAKESNELIADMTVLKVDSDNGIPIWRRDYGADNETAGNAFPTTDGGAISIGTVSSYNQDKTDLNGKYTADKDTVIMKTDSKGSWEWDINLGETKLDDQGLHIEESYDGNGDFDGYIMSGLKETAAEDKDIWTAKLEEVENPEAGEDKFELAWEKTYGGTGEETVGNITTTNDGGYVLTGSIDENGDRNLWAKKLNHDGSEDWSRDYGGSGSDYGNYIEQTADGGYIITGSSSSDDLGSSELQGSDDLLLVRLDETGQVQWSDLLGGSAADRGKSVREFEDGRYIVTGSSASTDGDLESRVDNQELDKESMWTLEYSRAFTEESFSPEREAEKAAPIGTGKIFLDIAQAQVEFDWEENEVTRISAEAEQRTDAKFGVQNGPNASGKTLTRIDNLRLEELGFEEGWLDGDFSDENYINNSLEKLDSAIGKMSSARSEIGAFTNRLEHSLNNTENYKTNLEASNSRIKDIDVAKEMMSQVRHQIFQQASLAMLAQVNQSMQTSLQLFN